MSLISLAHTDGIASESTPRRGPLSLPAFAGLVLAALGAGLVLMAFYTRKGSYNSDWLTFYQAAERWRDGKRVYTVADGFFNPPPFLLLMRAAIELSYENSRLVWGALSTGMLLLSAELTAHACEWQVDARQRVLGALWILLSAPVVLLVPVTGNWSAIVVLAFAGSLTLFRRGNEGLAGAILACALVKPQLAILAPVLLLYKRRWRALAGYLATVLLAAAATVPFTGLSIFADYIDVQRTVSGWTSNNDALQLDVPGIHGMFLQHWPHATGAEVIADLCSLAVVVALAWYWRGEWQPRSRRFSLGWAQLVLATLLVTSFAHSYDLVLLIVPAVALFAVHRYLGRGRTALSPFLVPAIVALYVAPYLVLLFRHHFMVPAIVAAAALLWHVAPGHSGPTPSR